MDERSAECVDRCCETAARFWDIICERDWKEDLIQLALIQSWAVVVSKLVGSGGTNCLPRGKRI